MHFKINRSLIIPNYKNSFIFIIALQACSYIYAITSEEAAKLACESTGATTLNGIQEVIGIGAWIKLGVSAYEVGRDVKTHFCPNKEEQIHALEINKQLELIELRKKLRTCLIKNRTSIKKGSLDIPFQCEEAAFLLLNMISSDEIDRMIAIVDSFNK